jgi:hypothetical protein
MQLLKRVASSCVQNDDKQVRHHQSTGINNREPFGRQSIDAGDPRAPPVPPPRPRSRASSSSPSRLHRTSPGGAAILQKSTPSTTPRQQRRVLFKNNVAVYRFDSDSGADSSAYSSMSESSEMLNGEPRHHHGSRQQHRIGSGGNRLQNGCNGYGARPQPPVPGDPESDRPHVIPIWYGPPDSQLTGSSIRPPATSSSAAASMGQSPRVAPPSGEQLSTLWVDDPRVSGQMLATNRSTTMVRVRYIEVLSNDGVYGHLAR